LVKHKDIGLYLQLYISIDLKINIQYTCVYDITENEEIMRKQYLLYEALTETTIVQLIIAL